jgi:hypothetical protein
MVSEANAREKAGNEDFVHDFGWSGDIVRCDVDGGTA